MTPKFAEYCRAAFPDVTFDRHLEDIRTALTSDPREDDGHWRPLLMGFAGGSNVGAEIRLEEALVQLARMAPNLRARVPVLGRPLALPKLRGADLLHIAGYLPDFVESTLPGSDGVFVVEGSAFTSSFSDDLSAFFIAGLRGAAAQGRPSVAMGVEADAMSPRLQTALEGVNSDTTLFMRNAASCQTIAAAGLAPHSGADLAWSFVPTRDNHAKAAAWARRQQGQLEGIALLCPVNPHVWPVSSNPARAERALKTKSPDPAQYSGTYFFASGPDMTERSLAHIERMKSLTVHLRSRHRLAPVLLAMDRIDLATCHAINAQRMKKLPIVWGGNASPGFIVALLHQARIVVSSRMHAVLLAAAGGTPAVGISHDNRIPALQNELGMSGFSTRHDTDAVLSWARDRIDAALQDRNALAARLFDATSDQRARLSAMYLALGDVLAPHLPATRPALPRLPAKAPVAAHPPMPDSANMLWARALADDLRAARITHAVLCPGGRNAPVNLCLGAVMARATSIIDERAAGFFAVGQARATGQPVVVSVTSGSAVAHLAPALLEARRARLPLVVVTADRGAGLASLDAAQTLDQMAALAPYTVTQIDLPLPHATPDALADMRKALRTTLSEPMHWPLHINITLPANLCPTEPDPLLDVAKTQSWLAQTASDVPERVVTHSPAVHTSPLSAKRALIVAGEGAGFARPALAALPPERQIPIVADHASGLRDLTAAMTAFDAISLAPALTDTPWDLVIRLGRAPVSNHTVKALSGVAAPVVKCASAEYSGDFLSAACTLVPESAASVADVLAMLPKQDRQWAARLHVANAAACAVRDRTPLEWSEVEACKIALNAGRGLVHLANSLSIRLANLWPAGTSTQVFSARGASGIEGTVAQFAGEMCGQRTSGLLVIGDQAFAHDAASLGLFSEMPKAQAVILVLDNGGGGIFDHLPVSRREGFERFVRQMPGTEAARFARAFGVPCREVSDGAALEAALATPAGGPEVIVARLAQGHARQTEALVRAMAEAAEHAFRQQTQVGAATEISC